MEGLISYIQHFDLFSILEQNLILGAIVSYFIGVLTALTPCVWPMYPITASIIVKGAGDSSSLSKNFFLSFIYVLGMSLMFSFIGLLSGIFGAGVQSFFRSPWVMIFLGLLFIVLAFSLFGFYELQLPYFIRKRFGQGGGFNQNNRMGIKSIFLLGLLSGVIASPCTLAPLAAILLFIAKTGNAFIGFLILLIFGLGIGTPLLLVGTFLGSSKKLPKSGKWMYALQYFLGIILIVVGLYFIVPSTKLILNSKANTKSTLQNNNVKPNKTVRHDNVVCDTVTGVCQLVEDAKKTDEKVNTKKEDNYWRRIFRKHDLDSDYYAKKRPFLMKFEAEWCEYCKKMGKEIFSLDEFYEKTSNISLLYFDGTNPDKEGKKLLLYYNVVGFPTILAYNGEKDTLLMGYRSKKEMFEFIDNFFTKDNKQKQEKPNFILE